MAKVFFTPEGIASKKEELYDLNDRDLTIQADRIRTEFKDWARDNFDLTIDQQTYLAGLSGKFLLYISTMTSAAIQNRLDIYLETSKSESGSKRFEIPIDCDAAFEDGVENKVSGKLTYNVKYPE